MENEKSLVAELFSVERIKEQMDNVHKLMKDIMQENEHYGVIPGTKKKSLYKQGAEKLSMMFRLAPKYKIEKTEMPNGHREISVSCLILHIPTQTIMAEGVGSCSTMESKYRYRNVSGFDILDQEIPKDAKDNKAAYRKKGFGMQKTDDQGWVWVKYKSGDKQENPDIADVYNTVLKMAKKRAHIDAILTATGASDIFTQDYEPNEEPPPPQYESEQEASERLKACGDLIDLGKLSNQYKIDWKTEVTGWTGETWNRLVAVMKAKKEALEKQFESSVEGEPEPQKEEPPTSAEGEQVHIEADWY